MEGRTANTGSSQRNTTALSGVDGCREFIDAEREELLWLATIILGSAAEAEECVTESMRCGDLASHIAPNWIGPWMKRSVAKIAISRTSAEIRRVAASLSGPISGGIPDRCVRGSNYPNLRTVPVEQITGRIDALERAALILHSYLGFSVLDCALLMGCMRALVAPACASAFERITDKNFTISAQNAIHDDRGSADEEAA